MLLRCVHVHAKEKGLMVGIQGIKRDNSRVHMAGGDARKTKMTGIQSPESERRY